MFFDNSKDSSLAQLMKGKSEKLEEHSYTEEFIQLYYKNMNKQQYQQIAKLYLPDALLVWNGVSSVGKNSIEQFFSKLPQSTYTVNSLDMQCLQNNVDQKTFLIQTFGIVQFEGYAPKQFFQTFYTTLIDNKYKITIDNYRSDD